MSNRPRHPDHDYPRHYRNEQLKSHAFDFHEDNYKLGAPQLKERGVLIYTRIGEKGERKINNDNLIERKSQILTPSTEKLETTEPTGEMEDIEDLEMVDWGKGRFFGSFFCKRCKEEGHYESNCTHPIEKYSCLFCLGQHTADACTSVVCFKCFSQGHKIRNCPSGGGSRPCPTCEKKHKGECGVMVYTHNNIKREGESIFCFACGSKGHINCFNRFGLSDNVFSN